MIKYYRNAIIDMNLFNNVVNKFENDDLIDSVKIILNLMEG